MSLLASMAASSRVRADAARAAESLDALRKRALATPPAPALVLSDFDIIAEVKLRAPSAGSLATPADPVAEAVRRATAYAGAGAAAISVLTEPSRFDGHLDHARAAAAAVSVPVMRKDFLVDPYQVWEARAIGAGGVLVIVRMLDDATLQALVDAAAEAGLFVLIECFDAEDLVRARTVGWSGGQPLLVGVNCRDLVTLEVDLARMTSLSLPAHLPCVAESGVTGPADLPPLVAAGYRLALVGTALMRAASPAELLGDLLLAGRAACASQ